MKIEKAFPSKYLRAADIEAPFVATVEDVAMMQFEDGEKPVLALNNGQQIVLNRTRASALASGFGTGETEDWPGLRVAVSVERIPYRGTEVDAIKLAVPAKEEADKTLDSDIPF